MKIVTFSDIHGYLNIDLIEWFDKNPADLLIFAGDLQYNSGDTGIEFIEWLHILPYPNKIMIFGNHDGNYNDTIKYLAHNQYKDIVILNNDVITIDNIKIFGSPYSVEFGNWWFMKKDHELAEIWEKIPSNVDILVTHTPPYGILDRTFDGINAGSKTLLEKIKRLGNIKYHIFGHIHEGQGVKIINNTLFINASLLDMRYRMTYNPIIFDYDAEILEQDYNVGE